MYSRLDLELISKSCKEMERTSNFLINFGVKNLIMKEDPPKKTLMFECYNLVDFVKLGALTF
jgi:hypothetical protein